MEISDEICVQGEPNQEIDGKVEGYEKHTCDHFNELAS